MKQTGSLTSWQGRAQHLERELESIDHLLADIEERQSSARAILNRGLGHFLQSKGSKLDRKAAVIQLQDAQRKVRDLTGLTKGTRERIAETTQGGVMSEVKHIDIKEFRELGFLQEANRQFFHPLGLALEVTVEEDGTEHLSGVWDYRDDPEGMIFAEGYGMDPEKAAYVEAERGNHVAHRFELFGFDELPVQHWAIQPLP